MWKPPGQKKGESYFHKNSWGKTPEEAKARYDAKEVARVEKIRLDLEKHRPVVTRISENGESLAVQFTRDNGERVSGVFSLTGWGFPPAELMHQALERDRRAAAMKKPVRMYYGGAPEPRKRKAKS